MEGIKLYINETIPGKRREEGAYYVRREDAHGTLYRWAKDEVDASWYFQPMVPGSPIYPWGLKEISPAFLDEEPGLREAVEGFYKEKDAES